MSTRHYVRHFLKRTWEKFYGSKTLFLVTSDALQPLCTSVTISDKEIYAQEDKGRQWLAIKTYFFIVRRTQLALAEMMKKFRMQQQAVVN